MTMPKSYSSKFIGNLIKMQGKVPRDSDIWHLLTIAVAQCREFNASESPEHRATLFALMERTRKQLRDAGLMVG